MLTVSIVESIVFSMEATNSQSLSASEPCSGCQDQRLVRTENYRLDSGLQQLKPCSVCKGVGPAADDIERDVLNPPKCFEPRTFNPKATVEIERITAESIAALRGAA